MLCSAAPEKVSALNLKRLKADNKTCGQPQKEKPPFGWFFFLECRGQGGTRCLDLREARQIQR